MQIGENAPDFNLKGVDNKQYSLDSFKDKKILIVIFSCNHCPYVVAYENRMIKLQDEFKDNVAFIAINPNNEITHPEDSFENMKIRDKEKNFNFPYLRDETQETAKAYKAERTPHIFLFDEERKLRYTGRIDDDWEDESKVTSEDLKKAIKSLLEGKEIKNKETHAIGCTIKWK